LGCSKVLAQMRDRRGARDQQDIRGPTQQPSEGDLHGRGAKTLGDIGQCRRLKRSEPAQRKIRHVRYSGGGKRIDQSVVAPMRQIVVVLYAHDLADAARFRDLRSRDIAHPDMTHEAFVLEFCKSGELYVVHATRHRTAQHGTCSIGIFRRTEYAGSRKLHGAIAEPTHAAAADPERAGLVDI
jgi:hypothetical protein